MGKDKVNKGHLMQTTVRFQLLSLASTKDLPFGDLKTILGTFCVPSARSIQY